MENLKLVLGDATADLANDFYSSLTVNCNAEEITMGPTLDFSWISHIEEALNYINNIYMNPKRFIISDEEILNIEKSKKITVESIKHLSKHSNFISEYNASTNQVKPSKILNVLKEETFDTYENRFIYTLTDLMVNFIARIEQINKNLVFEKNNKFSYSGVSNVAGEKIKCTFDLATEQKTDFNNSEEETLKRIAIIKNNINSWKQTDLYKSLKKERVLKVTHPIKRTNVILKNPNFQIAVKLWDYLYNYKITQNEVDKDHSVNSTLPSDLQKLADNSFLIYYLLMRYMNCNSQATRDEYRRYINQTAYQLFGDSSKLDLTSGEKSIKDNSNTDSKSIKEIEIRKEVDKTIISSKIRSSIKIYLEKIEGSYFELSGD